MRRSTSSTSWPAKWALALRQEMQMAIGQQLRIECELPQELPPELSALLAHGDKERDRYADIVGTC